MFLKPSDFIGVYNIPNYIENQLVEDNNLTTDIVMSIYSGAMKKELISLLGFNLYSLLIDNIDLSQQNRLKSTAEARFDQLLNGSDTNYGLVDAFIPFVYYNYIKNTDTTLTEVGEVNVKSKASNNNVNHYKAINAINDFQEKCYGDNYDETIIGEFDDLYYILWGQDENQIKDVYSYLINNKDIFPEFNGKKKFHSINKFGI